MVPKVGDYSNDKILTTVCSLRTRSHLRIVILYRPSNWTQEMYCKSVSEMQTTISTDRNAWPRYMPPGTPHTVVTFRHSLAVGGHYLSGQQLDLCLRSRWQDSIWSNQWNNVDGDVPEQLTGRMMIYAAACIMGRVGKPRRVDGTYLKAEGESAAPIPVSAELPSTQWETPAQDEDYDPDAQPHEKQRHEPADPTSIHAESTASGHQAATGSPYPHSQLAALVYMCINHNELRPIEMPRTTVPTAAERAIHSAAIVQRRHAARVAQALRSFLRNRRENDAYACLLNRIEDVERVYRIRESRCWPSRDSVLHDRAIERECIPEALARIRYFGGRFASETDLKRHLDQWESTQAMQCGIDGAVNACGSSSMATIENLSASPASSPSPPPMIDVDMENDGDAPKEVELAIPTAPTTVKGSRDSGTVNRGRSRGRGKRGRGGGRRKGRGKGVKALNSPSPDRPESEDSDHGGNASTTPCTGAIKEPEAGTPTPGPSSAPLNPPERDVSEVDHHPASYH